MRSTLRAYRNPLVASECELQLEVMDSACDAASSSSSSAPPFFSLPDRAPAFRKGGCVEK